MPSISINNEAEWHSVRDRHVGGSEVANLFYRWYINGEVVVRHMFETIPDDAVPLGCLGQYSTGYAMFMDKLGEVKAKDIGEQERVKAGTFLEPALAAWAGNKWEWSLRKVRRYLQHDKVQGWGATLDYEQTTGEPVEFKNVDGLIFRREWMEANDEIILPPLHINLQLQHQIGVANATHGWIVACVGGNLLLRGKIERHEPTQERIAQAIEAFWLAIEKRFIPERVADIDSVAEQFAAGVPEKIVDLTPDQKLPPIIRRYLRWKEHLANVDTHVNNLKGRICQRMGEATKATAEGFNLSWGAVNTPAKMVPARWQDAKSHRGALYVTVPKPPKGKKK